jgi:hypothetical protein
MHNCEELRLLFIVISGVSDAEQLLAGDSIHLGLRGPSGMKHALLQVRDLLIEKGAENRNLEVQNTRNSGTNVPDAQQIEVSNTQDVLDVMERGQSNRATADTKMNEVPLP